MGLHGFVRPGTLVRYADGTNLTSQKFYLHLSGSVLAVQTPGHRSSNSPTISFLTSGLVQMDTVKQLTVLC